MKTHLIIGMILALSGFCSTSCLSQSTNVFSAGHVIVPASHIYIHGISTWKLEQWKLEESDVSAVEASIYALFANPDKRIKGLLEDNPKRAPFPLSDYYMQYASVIIKGGKKLIIGKGFHKLKKNPKLVLQSSSQLVICGGGSYYFTVVYDVADKRILELEYNAGF